MNQQGINTSCWYCSDETLEGHRDRQFNADVKWDIPILDGYSYQFFKNYSWKPSLYNGFFGLINWGVIRTLFKQPKSIVIVHGWSYLTHVLVIIFGFLAGHTVCLRAETPLNQELLKNKLNRNLKRIFLRGFLFRWVHKFLYIGNQNKLFYEYLGVDDGKLLFVPYSIDNERFQQEAFKWKGKKKELRRTIGLPEDAHIFLFSGKYIQKKRPLDLLEAFKALPLPNACLVMVGDGELRVEMEEFIQRYQLQKVYLTGFINQSEIVKYYAASDVFVMCSEAGETWGLSVNEAMNFDLPIVVSSISGCSSDLIVEGQNGFTFTSNHISELSQKMEMALRLNGSEGHEIIEKYSYTTIVQSLGLIAK